MCPAPGRGGPGERTHRGQTGLKTAEDRGRERRDADELTAEPREGGLGKRGPLSEQSGQGGTARLTAPSKRSNLNLIRTAAAGPHQRAPPRFPSRGRSGPTEAPSPPKPGLRLPTRLDGLCPRGSSVNIHSVPREGGSRLPPGETAWEVPVGGKTTTVTRFLLFTEREQHHKGEGEVLRVLSPPLGWEPRHRDEARGSGGRLAAPRVPTPPGREGLRDEGSGQGYQ